MLRASGFRFRVDEIQPCGRCKKQHCIFEIQAESNRASAQLGTEGFRVQGFRGLGSVTWGLNVYGLGFSNKPRKHLQLFSQPGVSPRPRTPVLVHNR